MATIRDANGGIVTAAVTWSIDDPTTASVSSSGLVTALAIGNTTLTATGGGATNSIQVRVFQIGASISVPVSSIDLAAPGENFQLTWTVFDALGSAIANHGLGAVGTSDSAIATIALAGLVTAVAPGTATVTIQGFPPVISIPVTVAASPAAGGIVFTSSVAAQWEIVRADEDGSNQVNLTNDPATDEYPTVSSDGTKIAFVTDRDGVRQIYVMNADGSSPVNVSDDPVTHNFPDWSPDGTKIAYVTNVTDITVMDADGANKTTLLPGGHPDWSPDGTQIAYAATNDIWVMDADGSNPVQLTTDPSADTHPRWSPDGSKISFVALRDGDNEIYVMDPDGTNQVNITNDATGNDAAHNWSPDGSQIAFGTTRTGNADIFIMNADGSNQVQVTTSLGLDLWPDWNR